jgi:hypothetical protein
MRVNDPSTWPADLRPIRFEHATGELARTGELTLRSASGAELASLLPLLANECAVSVNDGRGTMITMPPGSWEISVYDNQGALNEIHVLARAADVEDDREALTAGLRTWAILSVLSSYSAAEWGHG